MVDNDRTSVFVQNSTGYFSLSGPLPSSSGTSSPVVVTSNDVDIGDAECRQSRYTIYLDNIYSSSTISTIYLCREDYVEIAGGWGGTDPNNALYTRDR